jgi:type VI secretion system protein ImpA
MELPLTSTPLAVPALDDALQALLLPVPGADPCGVSIRASALFTDIRLAREEDDPTLPMRQWERPLKKADWPWIEATCTEALCSRSKDLQLAAWLTEAWARQDAGIAGLARGLTLLRELVTQHWDGVHPRMDPPQDGDDYEARLAVFEWLDSAMAHTLRVFVCLLPLAQRKPQQVTLSDWERLIAGELSGASPAASGDGPPLTRDEILANLAHYQPQVVQVRYAQVHEARASLLGLVAALDAHLGAESPTLRRMLAVLDALERVLAQVLAALPEPAAGGDQEAGDAARSAQAVEGVQEMPAEPPEAQEAHEAHEAAQRPSASQPPVVLGAWRHRDEAYRTLEALAEYLATVEPHSPTPYLIRRAVNWGRLPLPELMAEIMREEGDLNRMVQLLGLGGR